MIQTTPARSDPLQGVIMCIRNVLVQSDISISLGSFIVTLCSWESLWKNTFTTIFELNVSKLDLILIEIQTEKEISMIAKH